MKGRKEEVKAMGPMFPRLHVKDADKGGPRAPPRNKMALYEQLSIPSQRFNPPATSTLPVLPYNTGTSVHSASSSQDGGQEKSEFSPFHMPPKSPAHLTEVVQSHPSNGKNITSINTEFERRYVRYTHPKSSNAAGAVAKCTSIPPPVLSRAKASCGEKFDDKDYFMVPKFVQSEISYSDKDKFLMEKMMFTPLFAKGSQRSCFTALEPSIQSPSSYDNPFEHSDADIRSRKDFRRLVSKGTEIFEEKMKKSLSNIVSGEKFAASLYSFNASSDKKDTSFKLVSEKTCYGNTGMHNESGSEARNQPGCLSNLRFTENEDALRVRSPSSKVLFGNSHGAPYVAETCNGGNDDKTR